MVLLLKEYNQGQRLTYGTIPSIVTIDQIMTRTRLWPFFCSVQQWPTPKASIKFIKSFYLLIYLFIYLSFYYPHHPPFMPSLLWKAELQHSPYEFNILTGAFWQLFFHPLQRYPPLSTPATQAYQKTLNGGSMMRHNNVFSLIKIGFCWESCEGLPRICLCCLSYHCKSLITK